MDVMQNISSPTGTGMCVGRAARNRVQSGTRYSEASANKDQVTPTRIHLVSY